MQKTIRIGTIIYLCFMCLAVNAQEEVKEVKPAMESKNVIKINLPALAFRNISLQYERAVGKRTSVALQVKTIPEGKLPFHTTFENIADDPDVKIGQFRLGTFGVSPEFRYYVGKNGALRGFYLGLFGSYTNYTMTLPIEYNNKTSLFDGKLNAITGGLQLGAQFRLSKSLTLDWWIFGPNYGSADGTLTFTSGTPLTQTEQDELRNELKDLQDNAPLNTIKSYSVNANGASVTAKGPWGGFRGGLNLGFRF